MKMCWRLWKWEVSYSFCFFFASSWVTMHLSQRPARSLDEKPWPGACYHTSPWETSTTHVQKGAHPTRHETCEQNCQQSHSPVLLPPHHPSVWGSSPVPALQVAEKLLKCYSPLLGGTKTQAVPLGEHTHCHRAVLS